jgi:hypothetical protein
VTFLAFHPERNRYRNAYSAIHGKHLRAGATVAHNAKSSVVREL